MQTAVIAVISDIHGNKQALEAVLRNIDARGIPRIVNLGDALFGPLDPVGTAKLLMARPNMTHIRGNCDRYLLQDEMDSATFRYVKPQLTAEIEAWLRAFARTAVLSDALFCHGTPFSDEAYLLEEVTASGVRDRDRDALMAELAPIGQRVIFAGHTHLQKTVRLPDGKLLVNPGSVGLPAYEETLPFPHAMESGTPHARYAIASRQGEQWDIELVALTYAHEEAAEIAARNGRDDYSHAIRYGSVLG
ncbi:metallophosphoesterase family protein [Paenibacillus xanthanilyticus]|uniref:Metallophosphoesterase family protein n=1 Tax=Paenibacillus xanthanilyticus TaxID=1783531 RepID=A0ABV8K0R2_9BACL